MVRNICAHHGRLWNRVLGNKPKLPLENKYPGWHIPVKIPNDKVFVVLSILNYLLGIIAPQSRWKSRLLSLLDEYPKVCRSDMGFLDNWQESLLWK
jgi:abortive infection bacteriophage resistance protein